MSHYKNFLEELPKRSLKLLNDYYTGECKKKPNSNEVTLLISLAMPVFVITSELIKKGKQSDEESKISKINTNLNKRNINTVIFKNISENWEYGLDTSLRSLSEIEFIKDSKPMIKSGQVPLSVLTQIRHALSHAEIKFTTANTNEIAKILFKSEKRKDQKDKAGKVIGNIIVGHHLNLIPVYDFKILLENWCNFLMKVGVNEGLNQLQEQEKLLNAA